MKKTKVPKTVRLMLTKKQLKQLKRVIDFAEHELSLGNKGAIVAQIYHADLYHERGEMAVGFIIPKYAQKLKKVFDSHNMVVDKVL